MKRTSGILLHVSSLPNEYGIGTFGTECYEFIDFLADAKQSLWEILPLNQTGFGDSPYSSCCSYSFNPYFISPDALVGQGLIEKSELTSFIDKTPFVDYGRLYNTRYDLLRKAFSRFDKKDAEFKKFLKKGEYKDYALYMTLKTHFNNKAFYDWPDEFKFRDKKALSAFEKEHQEDLAFWQYIQFEASNEWNMVKGYANENGVKIIGDMPLYVAYDSVDVWANPTIFKLDENLTPKKVAGVPPDYFSKTGQLWGNPVYDYDELEKQDFKWWTNRFKNTLKIYDFIRIDHFRGFDRYYEIDYGESTALNGKWVEVPSDKLFNKVHEKISDKKVIAEDLGIIDDGVRDLLKKVGYPGMRVLSFAFDGEENNAYLPENVEKNSICYTGTHDNDTLIGLIDHFSKWDYDNLVKGVKKSAKKLGLKVNCSTKTGLAKAIIKLGYASRADVFIIPMQDACLLNGDYRMNTPGREIANWTVKIPKKYFNTKTKNYLKELTIQYKR
ncbi:MAG: 4-alpha-glucanotransferase [Clostridia bacterium]|nr:4-alpha-glucanotransferase [Clostridia bacterium]